MWNLVFRSIGQLSSHTTNVRTIHTTAALLAEPMKKKRRIDPALLKLRTERKIRKIERHIDWTLSQPKKPIAIEEYQLSNSARRDYEGRPQHTLEEFGLTPTIIRGTRRLWSLHRDEQEKIISRSIRVMLKSQEIALEQLQIIDKDLYDETVRKDPEISVPFSVNHMRRETPPSCEYIPPDGRIKDVTKEYVF